jgi:hypothetical protein
VAGMARPILIALALLALAIAAVPAFAVAPKKGGAYVGVIPVSVSAGEKRIVLKVSSSGKTGKARLSCSGTRFGTSSKFDIVKGKFVAKRSVGTQLLWRLTGKFTSKTVAKAKLYTVAACDGKGGKVKLELDE